MDPFLPWPGSKAKCAKAIIAEFPESFGTYYEPFLGSGAVFFAMGSLSSWRTFQRAELSDSNRNLIGCWLAVMNQPEDVKARLRTNLELNSEEYYYVARRQMQDPGTFLYVMRAAFSSMYRENLKGEFNVPYRKGDFAAGRSISFDMEHISTSSEYLRQRKASITIAKWHSAIHDAKRGDLVYFDPPYLPYTENGFVEYSAGGFGEGDHVFLRTEARALSERGVFVALSNSDVPASRRLYGEPHKVLNVTNSVNAKATTKGTRAEGLWIWPAKGN